MRVFRGVGLMGHPKDDIFTESPPILAHTHFPGAISTGSISSFLFGHDLYGKLRKCIGVASRAIT